MMIVCLYPRQPQAPFVPVGLESAAFFWRYIAFRDFVLIFVDHSLPRIPCGQFVNSILREDAGKHGEISFGHRHIQYAV